METLPAQKTLLPDSSGRASLALRRVSAVESWPVVLPGRGCESGQLHTRIHPSRASLVAQTVKNPPAVWETWVWFLGWEDPMEKEMATPLFLPRESHGQRSLVGYSSRGCKESDMTEQQRLLSVPCFRRWRFFRGSHAPCEGLRVSVEGFRPLRVALCWQPLTAPSPLDAWASDGCAWAPRTVLLILNFSADKASTFHFSFGDLVNSLRKWIFTLEASEWVAEFTSFKRYSSFCFSIKKEQKQSMRARWYMGGYC